MAKCDYTSTFLDDLARVARSPVWKKNAKQWSNMKTTKTIITMLLLLGCLFGANPVERPVSAQETTNTYLPYVIKKIPLPAVGKPAGSKVAVGDFHACGVTPKGAVKCWGNNVTGILGDGTVFARTAPVSVIGLNANVVGIAASGSHTCALTTAGAVMCWGINQHGVLGDGTTSNRSAPVNVIGLSSGVKSISAGRDHNCAVMENGEVYCWGANDQGQLGDGTKIENHAPVQVVGLDVGAVAVSAGYQHTCALTTQGGVKCWGLGGAEIGKAQNAPVDVAGLTSGVTAISAGDGYTCAISTNRGAKCWGINGGRLGDGTNIDRPAPVDVVGLQSNTAVIDAGASATCAVTTGGGAKCWGLNSFGEVGDDSRNQRLSPVNVSDLGSSVSNIATNASSTCAILTDGKIKCWGKNEFGQVTGGNTSADYHTTPVFVAQFP